MYLPAVGSAVGLTYQPGRVRFVSKGGARTRGELAQFDIARSDADTTTAELGMQHVVAATAAVRRSGLLVVCESDVGDDLRGYGAVLGPAEALVQKDTGSIAAGDELAAHPSGYLTATLQAGDRIVARAREAVASPSTPTLAEVEFDGIHGITTRH